MATISEDAIRERAYWIWEREGRPQGCDFEHWVRAQVELLAEQTAGNGSAAAPRSRAAKPAAASNGKAAVPVKAAAPKTGAAKAAKPGRPVGARAGRTAKKPA